MSIEADIKAREDGLLVELTDLAMSLARDMAGRAKKSESLEDAERFTLAFDRMSRSVRLSISLRRRLERDAERHNADRRTEVVDLRKSRLRARLRSEIAEADLSFKQSLEAERELEATLAEDALYAAFVDLPLDEAISHLRDKLGLVPPPQGEGDREAVEGVQAHSRLRGRRPPQSAALTAPPEGEQLGRLKPAPS